jgi:hypothetical protein
MDGSGLACGPVGMHVGRLSGTRFSVGTRVSSDVIDGLSSKGRFASVDVLLIVLLCCGYQCLCLLTISA